MDCTSNQFIQAPAFDGKPNLRVVWILRSVESNFSEFLSSQSIPGAGPFDGSHAVSSPAGRLLPSINDASNGDSITVAASDNGSTPT